MQTADTIVFRDIDTADEAVVMVGYRLRVPWHCGVRVPALDDAVVSGWFRLRP
jgi:hypothetical protein